MCFAGVVQCSGVKLYELHVLDCCLCSVGHGYSITCGYVGVGGGSIYSTNTTGGQKRNFGEKSVHLAGVRVKNISTVTFNVWRMAVYLYAKVMLRDYFHRKMIFKYCYAWISADSFYKSALYLKSRVIGMMKNPKFRMSSFTVEVKGAVFRAVKVHSPLHKPLNACGRISYYLLHGCWVTDIIAGNHGIIYMLFKSIDFKIGNRSDATLGFCSIGLVYGSLAHYRHFSFFCLSHLEGK